MYSTSHLGSRGSTRPHRGNISLPVSAHGELFDAEGELCLKSAKQILCSVTDYRCTEISWREARNIGKKRSYTKMADAEANLHIQAGRLLNMQDLGLQRNEELFKKIYIGNTSHTNFNLGTMFAEGRDNVSKDYQSAALFFHKAAKAGLREAVCELGYVFLLGRGVERDAKVAAFLFLRAAKRGDATALCNLAALYAKGNGVMKDERMALGLFYRSYDAGNATAALNLSVMYLHGIGTEKCVRKAINYSHFAAKSDKETKELALHILSDISRTNADVPKNLQNSLRFLSDGVVQYR